MKRVFHLAGHAACLFAMIAMLGGHWVALQSVAWMRMLVEFSHQESLPAALCKTFDGQHPCRMCLQIRAGREQEQQQQKQVPAVKQVMHLEFVLGDAQNLLPLPPASACDAVPTVPLWCADFLAAPPTPPPRRLLPVPLASFPLVVAAWAGGHYQSSSHAPGHPVEEARSASVWDEMQQNLQRWVTARPCLEGGWSAPRL
jgi:hypothetical protein